MDFDTMPPNPEPIQQVLPPNLNATREVVQLLVDDANLSRLPTGTKLLLAAATHIDKHIPKHNFPFCLFILRLVSKTVAAILFTTIPLQLSAHFEQEFTHANLMDKRFGDRVSTKSEERHKGSDMRPNPLRKIAVAQVHASIESTRSNLAHLTCTNCARLLPRNELINRGPLKPRRDGLMEAFERLCRKCGILKMTFVIRPKPALHWPCVHCPTISAEYPVVGVADPSVEEEKVVANPTPSESKFKKSKHGKKKSKGKATAPSASTSTSTPAVAPATASTEAPAQGSLTQGEHEQARNEYFANPIDLDQGREELANYLTRVDGKPLPAKYVLCDNCNEVWRRGLVGELCMNSHFLPQQPKGFMARWVGKTLVRNPSEPGVSNPSGCDG